jgi:diaminopimelate decarboxylase
MTAETHIRPDSLSNGTGFYRNASNELCCEDTLLSDIAHRWGTPTYVYSRAAITVGMPTRQLSAPRPTKSAMQ